jgi:hypothetical protein
LTLLFFSKLESGDVLAAFLCLALAHRARLTGGRVPNDSPGILGLDEVEHGNTGRQGVQRRANEWRDRRAALMKLYTLGPKAFQRRFKLNRPQFDDLVEKIKPIVEVGKRGKEMAKRSSGSFVPAALQLAATLRWLAGAHHACQEDNYSLGSTTFFVSVWKCVYALDFVLPRPDFDPKDEGGLRALADGMYVRSGRLVPGCVGALDGMAVQIDRPSLKDTAAPLSYKNRKKYYSINLQAICDCDRKFIWWSMRSAGSTHDSLAWGTTKLAMLLQEFGLPPGFWIAADDAYPTSEYLVSPYSTHACRQDKSKDDFNFFQSRCRINVECAFGILVEKFGILRRSMSSTLPHNIKVTQVCMKLHNLGVENSITRVKPHARDFKNHDTILVVAQSNVSDSQPPHLKSRVKSALRDRLCDVVKDGGGVRPAANRSKRVRVS